MPTQTLEDALLSPLGQSFARVCRSLAQGGVVRKRDFTAEALGAKLLPGICIVDRLPPDRFFVRLAGTRLCETYGRDFTRLEIGQIATGEPPGVTRRTYLDACAGRTLFSQRVEFQAGPDQVAYERVIQPLVDDAGEVRWLGMWLLLISGPARKVVTELVEDGFVPLAG